MGKSLNDLSPLAALVETARLFYQRGWMPGTAGNLSARDRHNPRRFWITGSGLPKGHLEEHDFLCIDSDSTQIVGQPRSGLRPSAEAGIHLAVYQNVPAANACLHIHTVDACIAEQRHAKEGALPLPALEMIKGLGIWDESPQLSVPVFRNHAHVPQIADEIASWLKSYAVKVPALLIAGHGVTVWGESVQEAVNRIESIEFLFSYLART